MRSTQRKIISAKGHAYRQAGFTLIELLVVITIIAALAVTVFVALNPSKRLEDSRDARRMSDADTILSAVHSYIADNDGAFPTSIATLSAGVDYQIGTAVDPACTAITGVGGCTTVGSNDCVNLGTDLTDYLASVPVDPLGGDNTAAETGYVINVSASNLVTVKACRAEGGTNISVAR